MEQVSLSTNTPLSDVMARYISNNSAENWTLFLTVFRSSVVGTMAIGAPEGDVGEFTSSAARPVSVGLTNHAGGKPMVLAFADPEAFAAKFGRPFNAGISGEALLQTALLNPDCQGVLVNSALAEISVGIDRSTIEALTSAPGQQSKSKPWWKFW